MAPPKDRQRRFHRRSKNGCQSCKKRHVRCDEKKPLCTHCLQSGSDCVYPSSEQAVALSVASSASNTPQPQQFAVEATIPLNWSLNDYVGGAFEQLPESSRRLLRHFSQYAVQGQRPVAREVESSLIHRGFENPGHMHMCLMLAACQWAWVTGSMDGVSIPFLYHKAATYQFARAQLQNAETAQSGDTMLAISALALAEGAIGELDASSHHLKGIRSAMRRGSDRDHPPSLPQRMLKMHVLAQTPNLLHRDGANGPHRIGDGLRTGRSGRLMDVPDYQPTFMALLFASIWDITALPPREAPRYGWWEETDTQAARLWQNHTRDLNLNYEISRTYPPGEYIPRILNGDPRSSRTSFVATFFYLCSELGHRHLDAALIDWLLEQLIDDVNAGQSNLTTSAWCQPLWLWCVMFGAAVARQGRATTLLEERQLQKWRDRYGEKIVMVSSTLGINSWDSAKSLLAGIAGSMDEEVDLGLREVWDAAVMQGTATSTWLMRPAVVELNSEI